MSKKKKYPQQQLDKLIVKLVRQGRNTTKKTSETDISEVFFTFCDNSIIRLEYAYLARLCNLPLVNSRKGHHLRTVL